MDILFYVFAGATGVAASLAAIAIWAPRPTRVRVVALAIAMLFIPVVYAQSIEMLSKPKPASFEWYERAAENAELLGVSFEEGRSIYLWLRIAGVSEPRSYVVPWNIRLAEKLEDAIDGAIRNRSTILLKDPFFRRSLEEWGDLNVEIKPPPLPPLKRPAPPARVFNPRGENI